ncbi:hypothetical protein GF323_05650 [Candidatus Woesearchaeota archaeon]|nr:hypothetical protein [Candidatus Woesearchaeota archaeon]
MGVAGFIKKYYLGHNITERATMREKLLRDTVVVKSDLDDLLKIAAKEERNGKIANRILPTIGEIGAILLLALGGTSTYPLAFTAGGISEIARYGGKGRHEFDINTELLEALRYREDKRRFFRNPISWAAPLFSTDVRWISGSKDYIGMLFSGGEEDCNIIDGSCPLLSVYTDEECKEVEVYITENIFRSRHNGLVYGFAVMGEKGKSCWTNPDAMGGPLELQEFGSFLRRMINFTSSEDGIKALEDACRNNKKYIQRFIGIAFATEDLEKDLTKNSVSPYQIG